MMRREVKKGLLSFATRGAVESSTSQLAFLGCTSVPAAYEFDILQMSECQVTDDSFISGYLLHKFDFASDNYRLKAEFPHRSIQEFFAALYARRRIPLRVGSERELVVKAILSEDSQFGRFFLGLCSRFSVFVDMTEWLHLSFADISVLSFIDISSLIQWINSALIDCSESDQVLYGQALHKTVPQIKDQVVSGWDRRWHIVDLRNLSLHFEKGLSMNRIKPRIQGSGKLSYWSSASTTQTGFTAELVVLRMKSFTSLLGKFTKIDVLTWECFGSLMTSLCSQLAFLPPVNTLLIWSGSEISVTFFIRFSAELSPLELKTFRFQYDTAMRNLLLDQFIDCDTSEITTDDVTQTVANTFTYRRINVTVCHPVPQSSLIGSLIKVEILREDEVHIQTVERAHEVHEFNSCCAGAKRKIWQLLCFCRKGRFITHYSATATPLLE